MIPTFQSPAAPSDNQTARSAQLLSHRPFDVGPNGIFPLQSLLVGNTGSLAVSVDFAGVTIVAKVQVGPEVSPEVPPELVKASLVRSWDVADLSIDVDVAPDGLHFGVAV